MYSNQDLRDAYNGACLSLGRWGSLDASIKMRMCDILHCDPSTLESLLGTMSSVDVAEHIMS